MTDVVTRLKEYVTLPLIGRGHRGRLIQASMRDAADEIERLRAALVHVESMLSEHVEQYHDYEDPPHEPSERKRLVTIQHHIMGSLMGDVDQQRTEPSK